MNQWSEYVALNPYTESMLTKVFLDPPETLDIPCSDFCSYETEKIW